MPEQQVEHSKTAKPELVSWNLLTLLIKKSQVSRTRFSGTGVFKASIVAPSICYLLVQYNWGGSIFNFLNIKFWFNKQLLPLCRVLRWDEKRVKQNPFEFLKGSYRGRSILCEQNSLQVNQKTSSNIYEGEKKSDGYLPILPHVKALSCSSNCSNNCCCFN